MDEISLLLGHCSVRQTRPPQNTRKEHDVSEIKEFPTFIKALMSFFSMTPAQTIVEWKTLSADDKAWFQSALAEQGYSWPDPVKA